MVVFVDTSALFALISKTDMYHQRAIAQWLVWVDSPVDLVTTNYIILESSTLIQRRLGMQALQDFNRDMLPLLDIYWISRKIHTAALQTLLLAERRWLSLVDCSSFVVMNELGLDKVFTFDEHFAQHGFTILPSV